MSRIKKNWIISILVAIVSVYLYIIPAPIDPEPYYYPQPVPVLQGPLKINKHLQRAERLFEGQLVGPESFAVDKNGTLYTGTADGKILAFTKREIQVLARTGPLLPGCGTFEMEPVCGRPKGMKLDKDGFLIVADSSKGLLKVNTQTGSIQTLIPTSTEIGPFKFLNALDINKEGLIYFTDSTTKWDRRNYRYEVMEINHSGRLLEYNPVTNKTKVLLDEMYLANGIALSQDERFLVIAEMSVCRIRKYYLKGPKRGQSEIIADNLPGYPDNVKLNSKGNFYAGLGAVRYEGVSLIGPFLDLVGPFPAFKRFLTKIIPLALFDIFMPKHSIIIEFDKNGNIVSSLHDPSASVIRFAGEGFEFNGSLYIGNFKNPYIGRLNLGDINNDDIG